MAASMLINSLILCQVQSANLLSQNVMVSRMPHGECQDLKYCCPLDPPNDIKYLLFTRTNPDGPGFQLPMNNISKLENFFDAFRINRAKPTVIFVHGFLEMPSGTGNEGLSCRVLRDAYLQKGDYNVICLEWGRLAAMPWYPTAVKNTRVVGKYLANFIMNLNAIGIPVEDIHVIGFSLGGEVAGFAGKRLRDSNGNPRLGRITGLDPAFPLYEKGGSQSRLHFQDAKFVDVIHTDGGVFGFPASMGHVDFYPNGGTHYQPGCQPKNFRKRDKIGDFVSCSHLRSWKYYAETILRPDAFLATKCINNPNVESSCQSTKPVYMGFGVNREARGIYYVRTNSKPPYGRDADFKSTEEMRKLFNLLE